MIHLGKLFEVDPSFFFEGATNKDHGLGIEDEIRLALSGDLDCIRLNVAFRSIKDAVIRRCLLKLIQAIAESA